MSYKTEKGFELELEGAEYEFENGCVNRVVLKTSDFETGRITVKPRVRKQVGIVDEVPIFEDGQLPEVDELPENLKEVAITAAKKQGKVPVVADVTMLDRSDEPEMNGDGKYYFISQEDIDTLELRDIPGKETG